MPRKSRTKKNKKINLKKIAKESIMNDRKLKQKVNECMIEYAKTDENMKLTKKITVLSNKDKIKLSNYIKKEKLKLKKKKKKTKSKRIISGVGQFNAVSEIYHKALSEIP